jgi:hypothetical protein
MQIPVPKGRTVIAKFYKNVDLKKIKPYKRRRPSTGIKYLRLLHDDNAHLIRPGL